MKSFQQNLLIVLALCLCGLCAYQWYIQTLQRDQITRLDQVVYNKSISIRDATNSIDVLNHQIAQMDARLSDLKSLMKTNEALVVTQKCQINRLEETSDTLTNQISQYQQAIAALESKLQEAYDGIRKQNDSIKEVVGQRDNLVRKYNDSVQERNALVAKYNALVDQVKKIQGASK